MPFTKRIEQYMSTETVIYQVTNADAKDFIKALNGDPNYYSIEEVD